MILCDRDDRNPQGKNKNEIFNLMIFSNPWFYIHYPKKLKFLLFKFPFF